MSNIEREPLPPPAESALRTATRKTIERLIEERDETQAKATGGQSQ